MSKTTPHRIAAVVVVAGFVGLTGSLAGVAATGGSDDRPSIGGWPQDRNGDGVISDRGDERIPDLIRAVGDDGTEGYVWYPDLDGPQPSSPEEALKMSGLDRTIPLYSADGVTVIGTYTLSGDASGADTTVAEAAGQH